MKYFTSRYLHRLRIVLLSGAVLTLHGCSSDEPQADSNSLDATANTSPASQNSEPQGKQKTATDPSPAPIQPANLPFRLSPETTYITEPLTKDGLVDYVAYFNRKLSVGVIPQNNAAVVYWQAIGDSIDLTDAAGFFEKLKPALGADPFQQGGPCLVAYERVYEDYRGRPFATAGEQRWAEFNRAIDAPWKSDELPIAKLWLERNEEPLKLVLKATHMKHYYRPLISTGPHGEMINRLLPDVQAYRVITRMLRARAMLALGENRPEDAIQDLLAIHRLARHAAQGTALIEMLVGVSLDVNAFHGDQHLASHQQVSAAQLKQYTQDLNSLADFLDLRDIFQGERCTHLDTLQRIATMTRSGRDRDSEYLASLLLLDPPDTDSVDGFMTALSQHEIDWNVVLSETNRFYDSLDAALADPDFSSQQQKLGELDQKMREDVRSLSSLETKATFATGTPQARGQFFYGVFLGLLAPAADRGAITWEMNQAHTRLSQIGIAVAAYRKETGSVPESLEMLVPGYLPELPVDPFTKKDFIYRVNGKELLIYSVGRNLKDDNGTPIFEDRENHDYVFRITLP